MDRWDVIGANFSTHRLPEGKWVLYTDALILQERIDTLAKILQDEGILEEEPTVDPSSVYNSLTDWLTDIETAVVEHGCTLSSCDRPMERLIGAEAISGGLTMHFYLPFALAQSAGPLFRSSANREELLDRLAQGQKLSNYVVQVLNAD
jgi:hypothetical protein